MSYLKRLFSNKLCLPLIVLSGVCIILLSCKKDKTEKSIEKISASQIDSFKIKDSIRILDSIKKVDSLKLLDSIRYVDSVRVADSTRVADSIARANRLIYVGSGSGSLTIDGNNFNYKGVKYNFKNGDSVIIKGGSYNNITIQNISVPINGDRIVFTNDGTILLDGTKQMNLSNLNNITISGAGGSLTDRGFVFTNNTFRAVVLSGSINNFTFQNAYFKNINDYVIMYNGLDKVIYNGLPSSYMSNLAFLNIDAENVAPLIQFNGDITSNGYEGMIKGLEVANITCINSSPGAVVYIGCVEDFNCHNNYVNNINTSLNNHNGVFFIHGNGKFYNNHITNHEGNALRAWIFSITNTANIEIYNNVVYNSRRYGAFEIQVPDYIKLSSAFKAANAIVYNNTTGKLNTEKMTFPGRLLDVYNTYGTLSVYSNLLFNNNDGQILNNMSDTKIIKNDNNIYIQNETEAIENLNSFKSKIVGIGAQ